LLAGLLACWLAGLLVACWLACWLFSGRLFDCLYSLLVPNKKEHKGQSIFKIFHKN
jgi:hypothetical protein